jgi:DNA-binding transcriptional ArsR family regulator
MKESIETLKEEDWQALAERFKLLSDSSRLKILTTLCRQGESKVKSISTETGLNPPNLSKHLQLLRNAGVIDFRREGNCRYYRIVDSHLLDLCTLARLYRHN